MSSANGLKAQISETIEALPESSLQELAVFLEYLRYREARAGASDAPPYAPVSLGGLWQGVAMT